MNLENKTGFIEKLKSLLPFSSEKAPESNAISMIKRAVWNLFCIAIVPVVIPVLIIAKATNAVVNTCIRDRKIAAKEDVKPKMTQSNNNGEIDPEQNPAQIPPPMPATPPNNNQGGQLNPVKEPEVLFNNLNTLREPYNNKNKCNTVLKTIRENSEYPVDEEKFIRFLNECSNTEQEPGGQNAFKMSFNEAAALQGSNSIVAFYNSWDFKQDTKKLSSLHQKIERFAKEDNPKFDRLLGENICAKNHDEVNSTYEGALTKMRQNLSANVSAGVISENEAKTALAEEEVFLKYSYKKIPYNEAFKKLKKMPGKNANYITDRLNKTPFIEKTLLSHKEEEEFSLYREMLEIFYKHQIHGDSNCQSFIISMENFCRFGKYMQVRGVKEQIVIPASNKAVSPVPCWHYEDEKTAFIHGCDVNFKDAVVSGQLADSHPNKNSMSSLDGERYFVLKNSRQGGAGHLFMLVRSKSTGRFFAIDGQNKRIFPLLNPKNEFTYQSNDVFGESNVFTLRMDRIDNRNYLQEQEKSIKLLDENI